MSKKPTQKKPPFVIEPLNWVAPETKRDKDEGGDDAQSTAPRDDKN